MNRKSANTNSSADSTRCTHRTPSGRRCKMPIVALGHRLCGTHTDEVIKAERLNVCDALLENCHNFQTAQGINFALGAIFRLLAANCISARRASVLTFICSQLLRTLPAIDADNAAGIKGPVVAPPPALPDPPSITPPPPQSAPQLCSASTPPASSNAAPPADTASALSQQDSSAPPIAASTTNSSPAAKPPASPACPPTILVPPKQAAPSASPGPRLPVS